MTGGHCGKIPLAEGRAGAGQAAQLHVLLGKAWLSSGPSGCPSPSIKLPRELKNGNSTIPGVKKKSAKCLSPKRVVLFQLCFTRTVLFLKQPAWCCVPEGHHVPQGWGHWTCSGAIFGASLEPTCSVVHVKHLTALPALTVLGSATTSVGRPGFLCCLCRGAHNKGKNCCKSKNLQNQRNCVTSQHLWLQGLSSLWLLGVRATLPCWIAPSSLWVGWGFCAILMHSLTFGELSPGQACWSGASDNAGRLKSPLTPLHDSCIPLHVPQSPGR